MQNQGVTLCVFVMAVIGNFYLTTIHPVAIIDYDD